MKKLLVMFTAVSMITSTSSLAVSCGPDRNPYVSENNKVVLNKYNFQLDEDYIYATLIFGALVNDNTNITKFNAFFNDNDNHYIDYLKVKEELPVQDKYDKRIYHFTIIRDLRYSAIIDSEVSCTLSFNINNTIQFSNNLKTKITILPPMKQTQS
ncbi:hypothetical protein SSYRP_v1c09330 [Spiroplasma syrphidicola EA-1]|uniref:Lipoprotein n=1 Tax=Spiroplasma syrphidicola EA-1 TaxID=1276229 RepID=R4U4W4_9MOLU|nr:lipoprotein [Spiroplasma syrphidicola]AGM26522.1 hypothetical protein SSYRP_v1c09330 [Spiroplasma syrphidicola EA-1]